MTQLDLPQISLSRYVDLLKRRRWQVIPVSLLGLLIGGVVAFFIPRYFVAQTTIIYTQPPGSEGSINLEDPFGAIIDTAKLSIPRAVPETIKLLGWPEGQIEDAFARTEAANVIADRLTISELGNSKGRAYALVIVTYKDRDGERSAEFLNKLASTWIGQRLDEVLDGAKLTLTLANDEQRRQEQALDRYLKDRQHLEERYQLEPGIDIVVQREQHKRSTDAAMEKMKALTDNKKAVARLRAQLEYQRQRYREMPVRVEVDLKRLQAELANTPEGKQLVELLLLHTQSMDSFPKGSPNYRKFERHIQDDTARLMKLRPSAEIDADGFMLNPERALLLAAITKLELELTGAEAELAPEEDLLTKEAERLALQAEGYTQYDSLAQSLKQTQVAVDQASGRVGKATEMLGKLQNRPSVRQEVKAFVPPHPTDPNIVLVALLGCVVGLFAATALILLLDMLQGSYKTVDDVERGLAVPVLGGVSHLETEAQRRQSVRSRRRATMVAAAFLTLVGGVVLLYYYDPTRLPPFVRDMLAVVLGTA